MTTHANAPLRPIREILPNVSAGNVANPDRLLYLIDHNRFRLAPFDFTAFPS
jgi:hypothetical protein